MATPIVVSVIVDDVTDLERLTRDYWRAVQRVRRMAVPAHQRALVLADCRALFIESRNRLRVSVRFPYEPATNPYSVR